MSPWWFSKKQQNGLDRAISELENRIRLEENHMAEISDQFFRDGGVCCPSCGVPGYSEMQFKQERREKWLAQLKLKRGMGNEL